MRQCIVACVTTIAATCASAQISLADQSDAMLDALGMPEIVRIMRDEGIAYGGEMALDLVPGGNTAAWQRAVSDIYDVEAMDAMIRDSFEKSFTVTNADPLIDFFEGPGAEIVQLELSARRAMIDDRVETAAREAFRDSDGTREPRLELLERYVDSNDLIESNVVGALNASYQFYLGLVDGGAFEMSENEIVSEVWAQEDETRNDTREWLFAFLLLAYEPVDNALLQDFVDLSDTPEGQVMNRALITACNAMDDDLSYALGVAAAQQLQFQEL